MTASTARGQLLVCGVPVEAGGTGPADLFGGVRLARYGAHATASALRAAVRLPLSAQKQEPDLPNDLLDNLK